MRYDLVRDDSATDYFEIVPESGQIKVKSSLEGDTAGLYRVSLLC